MGGCFCRTWLYGLDLCDVSCGVRHDGFHPFLKREMDDFDAEKITARPREMSPAFPALTVYAAGAIAIGSARNCHGVLLTRPEMRVAFQQRRFDDPITSVHSAQRRSCKSLKSWVSRHGTEVNSGCLANATHLAKLQ